MFRAWQPGDFAAQPPSAQQRLDAMAAVLSGLVRALPSDSWHLKGSAAAVGWIGPAARLPNDLDLAVLSAPGRELLRESVLPAPAGDARITVLRRQAMVFSRAGRADVHRMLLDVDTSAGREPVLLNLLLPAPEFGPPHERTALLGFPGSEGEIRVPATTFGRSLAQKVLRYTHQREGRINTRWADLLDLLTAAACPHTPTLTLGGLRDEVAREFTPMRRQWPRVLPAPPREWLTYWDNAVFSSGQDLGRLDEAAEQLAAFWHPVLATPVPPFGDATTTTDATARWSAARWCWQNADDVSRSPAPR